MEYNTTITTTSSSTNFWVNGAGTDNWFIVTDMDIDNPTNSLETLRADFKELRDEFFMDHETEYHHNERLDRFYNRKADNEAIVALMS